MYALRGSWVGQTFAMAKGNESEGRKTRIRRSKEERKELVESFIKNYQISSNGNFPSLNLTHKEVGGSFYTVREIVREIIQENRVLGPAKLTSEEQNTDVMSEQYLLGSISMAPQIQRSMETSENESTTKHLIDNEDAVLNSNGLFVEQKSQTLVDVQTLSGSREEERNNEVDEVICEQFQMAISENESISNHLVINDGVILNSNGQCMELKSQTPVNVEMVSSSVEEERINEGDDLISDDLKIIDTLEADKSIEEHLETSPPTIQFFNNVIVEPFPMKPFPNPTYRLAGDSDDVKMYSSDTQLEKEEHEKSSSNGRSPENYSSLMDKPIPNDGGVLVEINCGCGNEIATEILDDQNVKCAGSSITEGTKDVIAPNGKPTNINGTNTSRKKESSPIKTIVKNKVDIQPSISVLKESKPTLDRINLESWDDASKKSADNPVIIIFKAFVAAFVKFWSE